MQRQQQQTLLKQTHQTHNRLSLMLQQANHKGLALRREQAKIKQIAKFLRSEECQAQLQEVADHYEDFSAMRVNLQKFQAQKKVGEGQVQTLKLQNQALRDKIEGLKYRISLQQQEERATQMEEEAVERTIEAIMKRITEQEREKEKIRLIQFEPTEIQANIQTALAEINVNIEEARENIQGKMHASLFKATTSNVNLTSEMLAMEIEATEKQILLEELQRSHQQLELKYRRTAGPEQERFLEKSEEDLKDQLEKLEAEHSSAITDLQREIIQEGKISLNIQSMATNQAMKKTRRFLAPRQADLAKKRKAVEQMLPIIQSSTEQGSEEVVVLVSELQELRKQEQYLNSFINPPPIAEVSVWRSLN